MKTELKKSRALTDKEFKEQLDEVKLKYPKLFQFIIAFLNREVSLEEVEMFKNLTREKQDKYLEERYKTVA
ncbi:TPA: hypothetical protein TUY17_000625 [Streptococcus equi subsp. zooepidemicus]|uniref:hypothetical protein n=1 Tax=Streptococcus equi TaxID=1336 RepID=UPI0005B70778|nr:hypothetical protein [Streptococcus equi]KIQ76514.1 hypothetical protein QQ41_00780 [Streptococcus equi subsp. zooepidemicus]MCD3424002.1 hypothetical protein [Streptococcus equi subsp. zooepidemicus]MCD3443340.1 hypothetical protein [Streptococcus equi subsp. zooepidemicus]QTZ57899.1 hypothetical protein JFMEOBDD_01992 [Streptococcus equi subsp. zooepidemicus]HEL0025411.1 hypothetical protein [Streptococcus equi subsp. zooepidemicus]